MPVSLNLLRAFYEDAFRRFNPNQRVPEIQVDFYPYIGINHTIRMRNGKAFVRIAELCRDLPPSAQRALAVILVGKLLRRRIPDAAKEIYSAAISTDEYRVRAAANRRKYGRKIITTSKGQFYDLDKIFDSLNNRYFDGSLPKPVLTWSQRKTYRILGHHDATHKTIVISKSLDSANVPRYVVEYIVFHEMLHIRHPVRVIGGRRYHHTPAFRRDERRFRYYEEAESWIEYNVRKLKREARKAK
jgi:hypothetical protein